MRLFEKFWPSKKEVKPAPHEMIFPLVHICMNGQKPSFDPGSIVLPFIDLRDPMKATLFTRYHNQLERMFTPHGFLSICPINDILSLSGVVLFGEAAAAYSWLNQLHCVRFSDMHRDIGRQIIPKINTVFSGGLE